MDPKGAPLASTDLLEISELVSGSYVTKSITGAEIVASVPPTSVEWGDIGGVLSTQIDLQNALNGKQDDITLTTTGTSGASTFVANTLNVPTYSLSGLGGVPTTRTLTINGTTQDLSADRTFTISTGITIGTTAITSGTVGRVLFEGTGNVVQESANLFWDNTNNRLGVGIAVPTSKLHVKFNGALTSGIDIDSTSFNTNHLSFSKDGVMRGQIGMNDNSGEIRYFCGAGGYYPTFWSNNTERMRIQASTGNIGINTSTDAGYKLDVNGTARVKGTGTTSATTAFTIQNSAGTNTFDVRDDGVATLSRLVVGTVRFNYFNSFNDAFTIMQSNPSTGNARFYQGVSVGTSSDPVASAILEAVSTTKGFLPPRMTTTQKNAIASPSAGLMVYDTTLNLMALYNGTTWTTL